MIISGMLRLSDNLKTMSFVHNVFSLEVKTKIKEVKVQGLVAQNWGQVQLGLHNDQ